MPLASKAADDVQTLVEAVAQQKAQTQARTTAARTLVYGPAKPAAQSKRGEPGPGEVSLVVSAPQYKEFQGAAGSYWMQAPATAQGAGPEAWLDIVRLAPASAKTDSGTQDQAALLSDPTLELAFVAAGSPMKITVKLQVPPEPALNLRVVAREQKTHDVTELTPQGNGVYAGELWLDPKTPAGDTTVTVAALNATPVNVDLRDDKEDPLLAYAARLGDLDADKPYRFDPRIMASENRIDLKIMVLDPSRETPPLPSTPVPTDVRVTEVTH